MICVKRDVLFDFGLVNTLQNGQAMAHADDAHLLQFIMFQCDQRFSHNFIFYQFDAFYQRPSIH